jgi:hypothetical protein
MRFAQKSSGESVLGLDDSRSARGDTDLYSGSINGLPPLL